MDSKRNRISIAYLLLLTSLVALAIASPRFLEGPLEETRFFWFVTCHVLLTGLTIGSMLWILCARRLSVGVALLLILLLFWTPILCTTIERTATGSTHKTRDALDAVGIRTHLNFVYDNLIHGLYSDLVPRLP